MTKFTLNLDGEEQEVEVTRQGNHLHVTYADKTAELELVHTDGAELLLEKILADGSRRRIRAAGHTGRGDERQVWVNGRYHTYQRVRQRGQSGGLGEGSLAATIPAVVTEILVSLGDTVNEGDRLILLESMKMVIPIQSPYHGTVTSINCTAGESVQAGIALIELTKIDD
ncbi:MAG: acetyl-CoA carboxylase biotin carboxyl carrier protein subunit [Anaerolineae bacterium]|nr:acetyl-CoA carboxylase biotin carboxyl carrier protein subunit [Anaerolineae bacterium]